MTRPHPRYARTLTAVVCLLLAGILLWRRTVGRVSWPRPGGTRRPAAVRATQPLAPGTLDGARALDEVRRFIAITPRDAGTPGAARAADHLAQRLTDLELTATVDVFTNATPRGNTVFRNVTARIPGQVPGVTILASHYDTKAGIGRPFSGANDSGSSTGLLLELARVMQSAGPPPTDVLIAFLDGEECMVRYGPTDGLHGSRRLAAALRDGGQAAAVRAVIVLDMVGDRDLTVTLPRNGTPWLTRLAFDAARAEGARAQFSLAPGAILDDHVPFLEAGMPAVDLIDFHFGSAPGRNDYWHTPGDTLDKLSAESLATVGRVVIRMLNQLARDP